MNNHQISEFKNVSRKILFKILKVAALLVVAVAFLPPSRSNFLVPPHH